MAQPPTPLNPRDGNQPKQPDVVNVDDDQFTGNIPTLTGGINIGKITYPRDSIHLNDLNPRDELPAYPRTAYKLAIAIGSVITLLLIIFFIDYCRNVIFIPRLQIAFPITDKDLANYETIIRSLSQQSSEVVTRIEGGITSIIGAVLLPVFTSIIGYIFGFTRSTRARDEDDEKPD